MVYAIEEAEWKHDQRQGYCRTEYVKDGIVYHIEECEYVDGVISGFCKYTWLNGGDEKTVEGKMNGKNPLLSEGIMKVRYYKSGETPSYLDGSVYEGELPQIDLKFTRHGKGKLTLKDQTVYEGTFEMDKKNGVFKVTSPDGSEKFCEFKNDVQVSTIYKKDNNTAEAEPAVSTENSDPRFLHVSFEENDQYSADLREHFRDIIGMHSVKKQLDAMYRRFKIDSMRQLALGVSASKQGYYFIITGNPGTGKTTVARIIGKMLYNMHLLPSDNFVEVDRSSLVGQYIGQTAPKTAEVIESARGGTLFIDEAYTLFKKDNEKDFGTEAIDTLLKDMEDHRGEYSVIMAGYAEQMSDMIRNANPGLASRFDHKIEIEDYSPDELVKILVLMAENRHFHIRKEAESVILSRINREKVDDTFDNARFARRLLDEAIETQAMRLSENLDDLNMEDLQILEARDFGETETNLSTLEDTLERLNHLIGLSSVKEEVQNMVRAIRIQNESRKRGLAIANNPIPLNMVFTGNPGTGKTTVARLLGEIYYHLGLLKRPDVFVECVRADLVGRYQGETAIKTKEVVHRALGGVLFVDEAYSLVSGDNDSFGQEAVNTLVSEIENNRDNLAVILAGYSKEMEEFLDTNSGLRSRLSRVIEFEDYTVEELCEIFGYDMKKRGYALNYDAEVLKARMVSESEKKDFGNARGVRNLCDKVIATHNNRINHMDIGSLDNEALITITDADLS